MRKYTIRTSKQVKKFLDRHPDITPRFLKKLDIMSVNPFSDALDFVRLEGVENHYRLRIGKYRFLYEIQGDSVLIYEYRADGRGDIYKK